jgi:hypothetical protein
VVTESPIRIVRQANVKRLNETDQTDVGFARSGPCLGRCDLERPGAYEPKTTGILVQEATAQLYLLEGDQDIVGCHIISAYFVREIASREDRFESRDSRC